MLSIELTFDEISYHQKKRSGEEAHFSPTAVNQSIIEIRKKISGEPAIDRLASIFSLSNFERKIILTCAGVQLNTQNAQVISGIHGNEDLVHPTFALLLQVFPDAHWDALSPGSSLRKWGLIELEEAPLLVNRALKIDETILHYLTGCKTFEEQLSLFIPNTESLYPLAESQEVQVQKITRYITKSYQQAKIIELQGNQTDDLCNMATKMAQNLSVKLYSLNLESLGGQLQGIRDIIRQWNRLSLLCNYGLYIDASHIEDLSVTASLRTFIEDCRTLVIIGTRPGLGTTFPNSVKFEIPDASIEDQRQLWEQAFQDQKEKPSLDPLVNQFHLSAGSIATIANSFQLENANTDIRLWSICCKETRPSFDNLAERIETKATWEDIVLQEDLEETLKEIVLHVRHKTLVYEDGGFAKKTSRGLGISALFYGESGTGKTMAAEVIANELNLNLYRIDLSQVVNKYIGETEKNLKKIFDAAESGSSILLFDEADALFGKRSDVRDSHDRYSNLQIGYLLQRMEQFRGLSILTTNMKNAIDRAFERRIRFIVNFERPDQSQRHKIWLKAFPNPNWVNGVNYKKLAQMNIPGGNIRNIAMSAAFLAASRNEKISMDHLLKATKNEYKKTDKRLSNIEIKNWNETEH